MNYSIENIAGVKYVIIRDGDDICQVPFDAIASWGILLGHSNPGETLDAILRYQEPLGEENIWGGLYEAIGVGLDQLAQAGVPAEFVEDLLQDTSAPFPTQEAREALEQVRSDSAESIRVSNPASLNIDSLKTELSDNYSEELKEDRIKFIDKLQPVYELKPAPNDAY